MHLQTAQNIMILITCKQYLYEYSQLLVFTGILTVFTRVRVIHNRQHCALQKRKLTYFDNTNNSLQPQAGLH